MPDPARRDGLLTHQRLFDRHSARWPDTQAGQEAIATAVGDMRYARDVAERCSDAE